jgi:hypothetical protein
VPAKQDAKIGRLQSQPVPPQTFDREREREGEKEKKREREIEIERDIERKRERKREREREREIESERQFCFILKRCEEEAKKLFENVEDLGSALNELERIVNEGKLTRLCVKRIIKEAYQDPAESAKRLTLYHFQMKTTRTHEKKEYNYRYPLLCTFLDVITTTVAYHDIKEVTMVEGDSLSVTNLRNALSHNQVTVDLAAGQVEMYDSLDRPVRHADDKAITIRSKTVHTRFLIKVDTLIDWAKKSFYELDKKCTEIKAVLDSLKQSTQKSEPAAVNPLDPREQVSAGGRGSSSLSSSSSLLSSAQGESKAEEIKSDVEAAAAAHEDDEDDDDDDDNDENWAAAIALSLHVASATEPRLAAEA